MLVRRVDVIRYYYVNGNTLELRPSYQLHEDGWNFSIQLQQEKCLECISGYPKISA